MVEVHTVRSSRLLRSASLASLILAGMVGWQPAMAQDAADAVADEDVIIVTGTSIRGAPPVGSSLIEVGRAQIEATPAVSTTDIIREIPQIFNFGVTDAARNQSGGAGNIVYGNSINIRGIGPYATLTLLNGRRPVPQGTLAASIDPSNVPSLALQRIEIIADGASAIYGSDAVSGVANLILRRNYDGVGIDAQYGIGDGYDSRNISAIFGRDWDSGKFVISAQHNYRSALAGEDREYYRSDLTDVGGSDYRVNQCSPGNIRIGSTNYAIPEGGASPSNLVAGTQNLCDNLVVTDLLPEQEINSVVATFDQDITGGLSFFADAMYARRDGKRRSATAVSTLNVPETNAFFVAPQGVTLPNCPGSAGAPAGTRCVQVLYSFEGQPDVANISAIQSEVWQFTGGFDLELPGEWRLNTYATYGKNHDSVNSTGGTLNNAAVAAALRSSDPATAFNPFGTSENRSDVLALMFNNITDTDGRSRLFDAGIRVDGPLFRLPGGQVKAAIGAEYYDLFLRTGQIRGPAGAQTGTDQRLTRDVQSAYAELLIPIFGPDNAIPGFESLDLNLAGRIDKYSDVGTTKNPKIGLNWNPFADLRLHGSYGESFRAPLLTQLVSAGGSRLFVQNYFDPTANGGAGATVRGVALSGGNLDLTPETARTWSAGFEYTPTALPGVQFTANYFDVVYEGQVNSLLSNLNLLRLESFYQSIILRGPAVGVRVQELLDSGRDVANSTVAEALAAPVFVDGRANNLGTTITRGLDFGVLVPFEVASVGDFRLGLQGTRFFTYKVALTPGGQITEQLNNIDYPLTFKARGSLGFDSGPFTGNVFVNYANGYDNTLATPVERIDANWTVDLSASYDLARAVGFARQLRLGVSVSNLFDADPPFVDIAPTNNGGGGFDPTNASPLGRVISVSLRTRM